MSIEIRPVATLEGIYECERLQKLVWGFEDLSVVPHHLIITTLKAGGLLLGAYEGEQMIGFVYSLPGLVLTSPKTQQIPLKHCSLMAAVRPEHRFHGVGYQLKLKQRDFVLSQGIDLITWTFDPLQSANAYFNFAKLGVLCGQYECNLYGDIRDQLNRGLPTDRFAVEWWLRSPRVIARLKRNPQVNSTVPDLPHINRTQLVRGCLTNVQIDLDRNEERLLLEIPRELRTLKENSPELAHRWRLETREIFEHYFRQGYIASEFLTPESPPRSYYVLERVQPDNLLKRKDLS
jgi:predicted GNAT superfamily acetyltransferase